MSIIALPCLQDMKPEIPVQSDFQKVDGRSFVDEVYIDDQNVLTISVEKMFEEQVKRVRKSRWGEKPEKKAKQQQNYQFDPLEAMMNRKAIMPISNNGYQQMNPMMNSMNPMNTLSLMNPMSQMNSMQFQLPSFPMFGQTAPAEEKSTKWGPDYEKTFQPPSLNAIPIGLSIDDLEYIIRLYCLDEVYQKLQRPIDLKNEDRDLRSPSPEPIYDSQGKRVSFFVNTRELRKKENNLRSKVNIIEELMKMRKTFVPPNDYRPLKKFRKIYLTDVLYTPDINYIGLIIGPKGQTQKLLENKTGCKISIRGKGASKTKRIELDSDDKLHVLIQAEIDENLDKGVNMVEKLLRGEDEDEFKKNQRLQMQVVAGVLRDDFCELCHEKGHRSWACPSKFAWTKAEVKCEICGERSHPTSDCPRRGVNKQQYIQSEYQKMMNDLEMKPATLNFDEREERPKERLNFITDATFTGFNLQQQLEADPEMKEQMKKYETDKKQDQQAQVSALSNYTLNNPQLTVKDYHIQQVSQQVDYGQSMGYPGYSQNMIGGYNPYYMNPMMYYGYNFSQYPQYGNTSQLALGQAQQPYAMPGTQQQQPYGVQRPQQQQPYQYNYQQPQQQFPPQPTPPSYQQQNPK